MKYTQDLVWSSIFELCPHFKVMKDIGLHPNLPSALRDTAVQCFLKKEGEEFKTNWNKVKAQHVVFVALTELTESAFMTFGNEESI